MRPEPALEHVALRRPRRLPGARAAALDVDDDARRLGHGRVADVLHHQREPGPARRGHGPRARPGGADDRGDAREFVLHGYEDPAGLREPPGHRFGDLGRGRDRVAAEEPAPGSKRPLRAGGVPLHELNPAQNSTSTLCGSNGFSSTQEMAWSGQIMWQIPQSIRP